MRVGVISDVHAHLDHLERALTILEAAGVDKVVCLGDVVEKGPQPDAVVELLDRLHIPTVQGNHDLNAVHHAQLEPRERGMSWDTIAWLEALPKTRHYTWAGKLVALAHASLGEGYPGIHPGEVPKCMRRALRRADPDVVLLGHTHIPMRFRWAHHWLCNPGSITKGRCGLGPTSAVLVLPEMTLEVYSMHSGDRVELGD
jgi:putative phosphoesterase